MKQVEERYISLLFEEAEIAKFSPKEVREYEASKMAYRDIKNSIDTAKQEGKEEGIAIGKEEGIAIGKEEGKNERNLEIAKDMLAMNIDEATIILGVFTTDYYSIFYR